MAHTVAPTVLTVSEDLGGVLQMLTSADPTQVNSGLELLLRQAATGKDISLFFPTIAQLFTNPQRKNYSLGALILFYQILLNFSCEGQYSVQIGDQICYDIINQTNSSVVVAAFKLLSRLPHDNKKEGKEVDLFANHLLNLIRPTGLSSSAGLRMKMASVESILVLLNGYTTIMATDDPTVKKWIHNFWSLIVYYIAKSTTSSSLVAMGFRAMGVAMVNYLTRPDIENNYEILDFFYHQLVQKADTDSIYSCIKSLQPQDKCIAIRKLGLLLTIIFDGTNQVKIISKMNYNKTSLIQKYVDKQKKTFTIKTLKAVQAEISQTETVNRAISLVSIHLLPFLETSPSPSDMVIYEVAITITNLFKTRASCPVSWVIGVCEALRKLLSTYCYEDQSKNETLCCHIFDLYLKSISLLHGTEGESYIINRLHFMVRNYLHSLPQNKRMSRFSLIWRIILRCSISHYRSEEYSIIENFLNNFTLPRIGKMESIEKDNNNNDFIRSPRSPQFDSNRAAKVESTISSDQQSDLLYIYCSLKALLLERFPSYLTTETFYAHSMKWMKTAFYFMKKYFVCITWKSIEKTFPIDSYFEICDIVFSTVLNYHVRLVFDFKRLYPTVNSKEILHIPKTISSNLSDLSKELRTFLHSWSDYFNSISDKRILVRLLSMFTSHYKDMPTPTIKQCLVSLGTHFLSRIDGAYQLGLASNDISNTLSSHPGSISHRIEKQETSEIDSELIALILSKIVYNSIEKDDIRNLILPLLDKFSNLFHNSEPFSYLKTVLLKDLYSPNQSISLKFDTNSHGNHSAFSTEGHYVPIKHNKFHEEWDFFLSHNDISDTILESPTHQLIEEESSQRPLHFANSPIIQSVFSHSAAYSLNTDTSHININTNSSVKKENVFGTSDPISLTITHTTQKESQKITLFFNLVNITEIVMEHVSCTILTYGPLVSKDDARSTQLIHQLNPLESFTFSREFSVVEFGYSGLNAIVSIGQRPLQTTNYENSAQTLHTFRSLDYNIPISDLVIPFVQCKTDFFQLQAHIQYKLQFRLDLCNMDVEKLDTQFHDISLKYHKVYYIDYANHFQVGFIGRTWWGTIVCVSIIGHVNKHENKIVLSFDVTSNSSPLIQVIKSYQNLWAYGFVGVKCGSSFKPGEKAEYIFSSDGVSNVGQKETTDKMSTRLKSKFSYISQSEIDIPNTQEVPLIENVQILNSWKLLKQKSLLNQNSHHHHGF